VRDLEDAGNEQAALRAAYTLGRAGDADCVGLLLDKLHRAALRFVERQAQDPDDSEATKHARQVESTLGSSWCSTARPRCTRAFLTPRWAEPHPPLRQAAVAQESMLGSAVAAFGRRGAPELRARIDAATESHHKALLLDCLVDSAGATADPASLACFARHIDDGSAWVRHNAMQGLDLAGPGAAPFAAAVGARLAADAEPFVRFAAISALFNQAPVGGGAALLPLLAPLLEHPQGLVAWKASETMYMIEHDLSRSCL
jgi:hypothetical protein